MSVLLGYSHNILENAGHRDGGSYARWHFKKHHGVFTIIFALFWMKQWITGWDLLGQAPERCLCSCAIYLLVIALQCLGSACDKVFPVVASSISVLFSTLSTLGFSLVWTPKPTLATFLILSSAVLLLQTLKDFFFNFIFLFHVWKSCKERVRNISLM